MDFFDLHCDTVSRLTEGGGIADADAHINLEKARTLGRWAQVFAVFVQDNAPGADTAYASYRLQTACFRAQLAANRERIVQCRTAQETEDAFEEGRRAAILSVENGAALGGSLERLAEFQRDGVRFLTLTWMGENELGCGGKRAARLRSSAVQWCVRCRSMALCRMFLTSPTRVWRRCLNVTVVRWWPRIPTCAVSRGTTAT